MLHIVYIKEIEKQSIHKRLLAFYHKKIVELCIYFSFREFIIFAVLQSGHRPFRVLRAGRSKLHPFHMHNLLIVSRTFSWLTTT